MSPVVGLLVSSGIMAVLQFVVPNGLLWARVLWIGFSLVFVYFLVQYIKQARRR